MNNKNRLKLITQTNFLVIERIISYCFKINNLLEVYRKISPEFIELGEKRIILDLLSEISN